MEKELKIDMSFYIVMEEGQTREDAEKKFYDIMSKIDEITEEEISYQVYDFEEQVY